MSIYAGMAIKNTRQVADLGNTDKIAQEKVGLVLHVRANALCDIANTK